MRQVFISYARENRSEVNALTDDLAALGYQSWLDTSLHGGQDWWREILQRIADSDVFVAVVSPQTLTSEACRRELKWAIALKKPVLPLAIGPVPAALPSALAIAHITAYSASDRHAALELAGALASLPAAPPLPAPLPEAPPAPLSYLTGLMDQVAQSEPLTREQQHQVLSALKPALASADPEERKGGRDVLTLLGSRPDLYAAVANELAQLGITPPSAWATASTAPADQTYPSGDGVSARRVADLHDEVRRHIEAGNFEAICDLHDELLASEPSAAEHLLDLVDPDTALAIGVEAADRQNLTAANTAYRRAATAGNTNAMYLLGGLLADSSDPPDLIGARGWYEKAAAAGDSDAMLSLALLLEDELDPPDLIGARSWYEKAAAAGNTDAMRGLGLLLESKLDPPDLIGARGWYEKAAAAGDTEAMTWLGRLLADVSDPPDLVGARGWYEKAAAAGDTEAMLELGDLLADKLDPPDLVGARSWYEKAAAPGDAFAPLAMVGLEKLKRRPFGKQSQVH